VKAFVIDKGESDAEKTKEMLCVSRVSEVGRREEYLLC
jgi:hypothetical protein